MQLRLEVGSDTRGYGPLEAGVPMKSPSFGNLLDRALMYAERGVFLYTLIRVAASDDFKEILKNRGF